VNLGVDVSPDAFVDATKKYQPEFVCMSSLLTTTMMAMKETIELLVKEGLRDKVKVLVGGAPVSKEFAASIGADGYGADAMMTKDLCMQMIRN
jgi:5-methyltetrahydrofolate--homocysteine methyltransferase